MRPLGLGACSPDAEALGFAGTGRSREGRPLPLNMHKLRSSLGNGKIQMQGRVNCRKETQASAAANARKGRGSGSRVVG